MDNARVSLSLTMTMASPTYPGCCLAESYDGVWHRPFRVPAQNGFIELVADDSKSNGELTFPPFPRPDMFQRVVEKRRVLESGGGGGGC